jgi:hypothetical protein
LKRQEVFGFSSRKYSNGTVRTATKCGAAALNSRTNRLEAMMVQLFQILTGHEDQCERGHSHSSMRAAIESALSADADLDCTEITVTMIGPYAVLEGFAHSAGDIVRAMMIAEDVVGQGNVQSRMLRR